MSNELLEKLRDDILNGNHYAKISAIDRLIEINNNKAFEILIKAVEDDDEEVSFKASLAFKDCSSKIQKKIISLFSHKKWKVRNLASDIIINNNNPSISTLIDTLKKDIDTNSKFWIIKTLGKLRNNKSFSILKNIIESGKEEEKLAAIESLSSIRDKKSINILIKSLIDENWHVRKKSSEILVEMGEIVVEELIKNIDSDNEDMFYWITKIIGKLRSVEAVESLISILDKNKDNEKREIIIKTLGTIGDEKSIDHLIMRLNDNSWTMRKYAAESLLLSGEKIVEKMVETYNDKNPDVRYWSVWILGKIDNKKSIEILQKSLNDEEWFVRSLAVSYIGNLKKYSLISELIKMVDDENPEVRKSVNKSIEQLRNKKAIKFLEEFISKQNDKYKKIAEKFLNSIIYES